VLSLEAPADIVRHVDASGARSDGISRSFSEVPVKMNEKVTRWKLTLVIDRGRRIDVWK